MAKPQITYKSLRSSASKKDVEAALNKISFSAIQYMQDIFTKILILSFFPFLLTAQVEQLSNLRVKNLEASTEFQILDSLTIVPNSLVLIDSINLDTIAAELYSFKNNKIAFLSNFENKAPIQLQAHYRVLPYNLNAPFARIDSTQSVVKEKDRIIGITYNPYEEEERVLEFKGLDYNGSFARGLSFGNSQNLVLNSSFNLQMAGNLGDGLEVLAAISDNNIPLQPEGNTQQLNEFDKIFVQISKKNNKLIAGDYELGIRPPQSYFMNYFKKSQGATFQNQSELFKKKKGTLTSRGSVAVARGKFTRNNPTAQEGNQGPYRLVGGEGERFIIVLAGTEKVWIDGKQMKRGLEADYVIDYNAGQITFTQQQLITKDSRIIVEFEYNDRNYLRSMYGVDLDFVQTDKMHLYFHLLSEQDGKQPVDDEFSTEESIALRDAGDNLLNTVVSSLDTIEEFSASRVQYQLQDSLVNGQLYENIMVHSTNPETALYTAVFSLVGEGFGNYILDTESLANGRVYRWVAPDPNGQATGNYEPVRRLVAPKQQQLYTLGMKFQPGKKSSIRTEIAMSNNDLNRLSSFDESDNLGFAGYVGWQQKFDLKQKKKVGWQLQTDLDYEAVQARFEDLNPYRPAEFTRDWNVQMTEKRTEHIGRGGFLLKHKEKGSLEYLFSGFLRDSIYTGTKHFGKYRFRKNGYDISAEGNLLVANSLTEESRFFRPKFNLSIPIFRDSTGKKFWIAGIYGEREKNERFAKSADNMTSDTLQFNSFYYDLFQVFLNSPESKIFNIGLNYKRRFDHAPVQQNFQQSTIADELGIQGNWKQGRASNLSWNFTYRQLEIKDETLTEENAAETFLGEMNYNIVLAKGAVRSTTSYKLESGQERKLEITYLKVEFGEGDYQWIDYNSDGSTQANEFEIAPFRDSANYIRTTIFTDEFIRTNKVEWNQSLNLDPRAVWFDAKGIKKFISKLSTQSSYQIQRNVLAQEGVSAWNPFQFEIADTSLISTRASIRNILFFNRNSPKYDFQFGRSDVQAKQLLTTGFESRRTEENFFKTRWNLSRSISTKLELSIGNRSLESEQFDNKNYNIRFRKIQPGLTWLHKKNFRATISYRYESSENILVADGESSLANDFKLEARFNQTSATSIQTSFSLVKIQFDGNANSPVGFAFLNGLQKGDNFLWTINFDRRVGKNIQLRIGYEGRKTGNSRLVHVGRAQVAATF